MESPKPTPPTSSVPIRSPTSARHSAALAANQLGLTATYKEICAAALQANMSQGQAMEMAIGRLREEAEKSSS
jgi:hypothetical protein